ncbi:unnamed protein product [Effrenium voratum]|uniref:Glycerophosphocholine acyltransferase 1 n=1 Tax=Effrenium voratum TaxID=2562239 RepID=A0AA36J2S9_9DINO|nr:unnamed protein product [Effrenium voratum]
MAGRALIADEESTLDPPTILRCIEVIDQRAEGLKAKGMSSASFFFGVTNVLIVTWCFGVMPQHFWIVYIFETLILFPIRWKNAAAAKPLSEVLYWLDFCWFCNFSMNIVLIIYVIDAYFNFPCMSFLMALDAIHVRKFLFCMFFGIQGPLLGAVGALGNALVFHDANNTVSVFIHLCPSLLAYTLRWHREEVLAAWPGLFELDYFKEVSPWVDVYRNAAIAYVIWWVLYSVWLQFSMDMPSKGYDTVFHLMMRGPNPVGPLLSWSPEESSQRAARNDFTRGSAVLYMVFHSMAVLPAILLSVLCWLSQAFHAFFCLAMTLAAIYKGSKRYAYFILESYLGEMRREFAAFVKPASALP